MGLLDPDSLLDQDQAKAWSLRVCILDAVAWAPRGCGGAFT